MTERILAFSFNSETLSNEKNRKNQKNNSLLDIIYSVILVTLNICSTISLYPASAKIVNDIFR